MRGGGVAYSRGHTLAQHPFSQIPSAHIERSVFNRSFGVKTAFNSGLLIPFFADEALPGDTFRLRTSSFVRMSTPIFPVMDNLYLDVFYFAVPIRLIWSHWQQFNGEQLNPGDSTAFLIPQFQNVQVAENSLSDYLGLPLTVGANVVGGPFNISFSSLWHRAYNLVYREWFRDENFVNSPVVDTGDGPDNLANYVLLRRGKRHDYFTASLPFTQKGTPVSLPLGSSAPVHLTSVVSQTIAPVGGQFPTWTGPEGVARTLGEVALQANPTWNPVPAVGQTTTTMGWNNPQLASTMSVAQFDAGTPFADLSAATSATINQIRQAFQIQRLLERDARGGSRYTEIVRSHFGVVSPDQRLQRPEYLGGGSTRINVHPVANTNLLGGPPLTQQAVLSGFGTATLHGVGFMKSFVEHCVVIGLINVRADLTYQQGMERMWSRRTRYDFYWPALAHLGEQAVLNQEIMATGVPAQDTGVWGYQERYAEYRYKPSIVTGTMRSTAGAPLDGWHLGLKFTALPVLNSTFIGDQPPMGRVLAVTTQPEFFGDFFHEYRCARPMPTFSVPGMIDHF